MKVLIVSFDKTLTENLKKALEGHEVYTAKNSEEALKMIPADVEGVIYDAISGAISEEDINTLYTKKFSNARYIILYDELFPVEEDNIIVSQKMLVPRDSEPSEIVKKLTEFPEEEAEKESYEPPPETEYEIEPTNLETAGMDTVGEPETPAAESVQEVEEEVPPVSAETPFEVEASTSTGTRKILIVSFDQTLIDSLRTALGQRYEVVSVKTVRQAMEQGKDADLIVFDAISGVIAEKGLIDMANDPVLASKPYVILVDDLFPINVDNIPLENKIALSRDTDTARIKEVVEEKITSAPAQTQEVPTAGLVEETTVEEPTEEAPQIEIEETPPEIEIEKELPQDIPEIEVEEVSHPTQDISTEEEVPALEALERFMESEEISKEVQEQEEVSEPATIPDFEEAPAVAPAEINIDKAIEEAVAKALSEERVKEAVSKALQESLGELRETIGELIRSELGKAFEEIDVKSLIKEATYQALKERLEELIT